MSPKPIALRCPLLLLLLLAASTARAEPPAVEAQVEAPKASRVLLDDAEPPDDGHDWVQLTNGEWMQGELTSLRDGRLEFDSDEFGDHTVDIEDVRRIFLRHQAEFGLTHLHLITGTAVLADGHFTITGPHGPVQMDRAQVLSIVPAGGSELERWSLDASFGLNLSRGNTQQGALNGAALIKREDGFTRFKIDYLGNYAETKGNRTAHNHRVVTRLDLFVSPRFFVTPAQVTLEYDRLKNIRMRATPAVGGGAHLIDRSGVEWDLSAAGGYQYTQYFSVAAGADKGVHNAAVALSTTFDADITDDLDYHFEYTSMVVATDLGLTTHHLVTSFEADITSVFDLGLRFVFDRIEDPVLREDGTKPKKNDFQLIASFGVELG